MKTPKTSILIFVSALLVHHHLFAQDEKKINTSMEVGFNAVEYGRIIINAYPGFMQQDIYVANGIFVKKHLENKSYRFGLNYKSAHINNRAVRDNEYTINGDFSGVSVFAGGEKAFYTRKFFQVYWGVDLSFVVSKFDGLAENTSNSTFYSTHTTSMNHGVGLGSFIGSRATFAKRIRLSMEAKFGGMISDQNDHIVRTLPVVEEKSEQGIDYDSTVQCYVTVSYLF